MQDRTIDNALLALRKRGGAQGKIAEALLDMRGVPLPNVYSTKQMRRGQASRYVVNALRDGPKTCPQIADLLGFDMPDLTRPELLQRVDNALRRVEAKVLVRREGRLWRLRPYDRKMSQSLHCVVEKDVMWSREGIMIQRIVFKPKPKKIVDAILYLALKGLELDQYRAVKAFRF